jgi:hypothetical protein
MVTFMRSLMLLLYLGISIACTSTLTTESAPVTSNNLTPKVTEQVGRQSVDEPAERACRLTEPVWAKPPDDAAVQGSPGFGYYFVNEDRSIWASAWWVGQKVNQLRASQDGFKVGWFRPAGASLEISGQRLDGPAPALEAHVPCCYPTRFQATGLIFPTEGCWTVTAKAAARELSLVVWVAP